MSRKDEARKLIEEGLRASKLSDASDVFLRLAVLYDVDLPDGDDYSDDEDAYYREEAYYA